MSNLRFVPQELQDLYEVHEWRNGLAVLAAARPDEWEDIKAALSEFRLYASEIIKKGGNRSAIAIRLDSLLEQRNWSEQGFDTFIRVGDEERKSPTHKVDMYKNRVAFETEWNNKDPFYDRDLNNFRLLFDLRVIDVGVIVTRCDELQQLVVELGRDKGSYGNSTTHMSKLLPRLEGGGGGGCPVVVFGIKRAAFVDDRANPVPPAKTRTVSAGDDEE
ncbi:MAG: BglII/BstYI family type II restriction endonuclease [Brevundimonas sp.]|jgi:hypothetical protein|uniref:BglII/BstYI family type II restriction endonuclease n=1 Tax=Brevundimonas sp. TaxID=1871086 RepID=UPI00391F150C